VAILPAGTANLLAANLGVPHDLAEAVQVGLHGDRRRIDTGSVNGERFTVMAGAGFDAQMISGADRRTKDRLGRAAYVVTGIRNLRARRMRATVEVDGKRFFELDGGVRPASKKLRIKVHPASVTVCVPPGRPAC
jgi:diacylglycerol kinase (ATP)